MADTIVLVIFYSRTGETERLAHAAAVGAVQARALIRLRRVPDIDPGKTLERFPESEESLRRMHREYVPPREVDVLDLDTADDVLNEGADALVDLLHPHVDLDHLGVLVLVDLQRPGTLGLEVREVGIQLQDGRSGLG